MTRGGLAFGVVLFGALALAVDVRFGVAGPRVNLSPSIPVGLYWFAPATTFEKGEIVVACFDGDAARFMRRVSDLGDGTCPSGIEPAAKVVAAVSPDVVSFGRDGVRVNGALWPMSRPIARYGPQSGSITLAPGKVLLMGLHPFSVDGRYIGDTPARAIGTWSPLLTKG